MTSKRTIVTARRTVPIRQHVYTFPIVRELPPNPPDPIGAQSLW
jgi:hypothetical protein